MILYSLPESPDTIDDNVTEMLNVDYWETILKHRLNALKQRAASKEEPMTGEELALKCKQVLREGRTSND